MSYVTCTECLNDVKLPEVLKYATKFNGLECPHCNEYQITESQIKSALNHAT